MDKSYKKLKKSFTIKKFLIILFVLVAPILSATVLGPYYALKRRRKRKKNLS